MKARQTCAAEGGLSIGRFVSGAACLIRQVVCDPRGPCSFEAAERL